RGGRLKGADQDGLRAGGAGGGGFALQRSATHVRDQDRHSGCAEDSAAQRLRLVFSRRARQVCPHARRYGRALTLAAGAGGSRFGASVVISPRSAPATAKRWCAWLPWQEKKLGKKKAPTSGA